MGITSASTLTSTGWWKPSRAFPKCLSPPPTTSACLVSTSKPSTTCALGMRMGWSQISTGKLGIALSWMETQTQAVGILWMKYFVMHQPVGGNPWESYAVLNCLSRVQLFATLWTVARIAGSSVPADSPGKNTRVVAMPSSRGSSRSRDRTQVSRIAHGFFTI